MDQSDPRHPMNRPLMGRTLGEIPGEATGQPPGLLGAPERDEYLRLHPDARSGYPQMPQPPPMPVGVSPAQVENQVRLWAQGLVGILGNNYIQDLIATLTTSWAKQAYRPVHQQPWEVEPFRAVPIGDITGIAGVALPAGGAWTTVVSDSVPQGFYGCLRWIGHAVASSAAWDDILWRLVWSPGTTLSSSPTPFRTFEGWAHQIGQIEAPTMLNAILIPEGTTFALQGSTQGATPYTVQGRLQGWMWPRTGGVADGVAGQIVL